MKCRICVLLVLFLLLPLAVFAEGQREMSFDAFPGQCAACHGDGLLHSLTGRTDVVVRDPDTGVCLSCHDAGRSPDFELRAYRQRLSH